MKILGGEIIPVGFDGDEQEFWEDERYDIEKCLEERERDLQLLAKELGIAPEEINNLSEIELDQTIEEKMEEKDQGDKEELQELSEEEVKIVKQSGINEIKTNTRIDTKGTTLAQSLNLNEYTKIMVVHSYKLSDVINSKGDNGKVNNMRFGIIAQKADGTYETIPESKLRPYRGANREVTEINDKEQLETNNEECMFEAPGTNKKIVISQKDPYGFPEVYLSQTTRDNDGNMAQRLQNSHEGTKRQDVEVRALFNANKGEYQADKSIEESREHTKAGCKDLDIDEVDGRDDTGHIHFNPDSQEQQNAVEEIMERGNVSKEEAELKLEKELESSRDDITLEEAVENAVEEIEQEYRGGDGRQG